MASHTLSLFCFAVYVPDFLVLFVCRLIFWMLHQESAYDSDFICIRQNCFTGRGLHSISHDLIFHSRPTFPQTSTIKSSHTGPLWTSVPTAPKTTHTPGKREPSHSRSITWVCRWPRTTVRVGTVGWRTTAGGCCRTRWRGDHKSWLQMLTNDFYFLLFCTLQCWSYF